CGRISDRNATIHTCRSSNFSATKTCRGSRATTVPSARHLEYTLGRRVSWLKIPAWLGVEDDYRNADCDSARLERMSGHALGATTASRACPGRCSHFHA